VMWFVVVGSNSSIRSTLVPAASYDAHGPDARTAVTRPVRLDMLSRNSDARDRALQLHAV